MPRSANDLRVQVRWREQQVADLQSVDDETAPGVVGDMEHGED